jgi:hypothetical protein
MQPRRGLATACVLRLILNAGGVREGHEALVTNVLLGLSMILPQLPHQAHLKQYTNLVLQVNSICCQLSNLLVCCKYIHASLGGDALDPVQLPLCGSQLQ